MILFREIHGQYEVISAVENTGPVCVTLQIPRSSCPEVFLLFLHFSAFCLSLYFWSLLSFQVPDRYKSQRGAVCPGVWGQHFHCLSTSDSAHFDCCGCQWAWVGHLHPGMIDSFNLTDGRKEGKLRSKASQLPGFGSRV